MSAFNQGRSTEPGLFAENRAPKSTLLDKLIRSAQAEPSIEPRFTSELRGYAERDLGRGDGWWLVQLLAVFEVVESRTGAGNSPETTRLPGLDHLVQEAHAVVMEPFGCITEVLWETHLELSESSDSLFSSSWKKNVSPKDQCGDILPFFGPDPKDPEVDLRLTKADDPNNPTKARLVLRDGKEDFEIKLTLGGKRLRVDCDGMACEDGPVD